MYLIRNATGQRHYPKMTNHFQPSSVIFAPHQHNQVIISDVGVLLWIGALAYWSMTRGFLEMARIYGVPYLWVNHWLVLITFLQHTDPFLPHYRASAFNFQRGALSTLDRSLLGGAGQLFGWLGGFLTHGISETHVLHHVSSKIPHYHAWEASDALRKRLAAAGLYLRGTPGGWTAVIHAIRTCRVSIKFHPIL
jgi:omega-6 fatty acid desaturase / acyl-lipid omega-6 desaturase (Delta-12 desaturase)